MLNIIDNQFKPSSLRISFITITIFIKDDAGNIRNSARNMKSSNSSTICWLNVNPSMLLLFKQNLNQFRHLNTHFTFNINKSFMSYNFAICLYLQRNWYWVLGNKNISIWNWYKLSMRYITLLKFQISAQPLTLQQSQHPKELVYLCQWSKRFFTFLI